MALLIGGQASRILPLTLDVFRTLARGREVVTGQVEQYQRSGDEEELRGVVMVVDGDSRYFEPHFGDFFTHDELFAFFPKAFNPFAVVQITFVNGKFVLTVTAASVELSRWVGHTFEPCDPMPCTAPVKTFAPPVQDPAFVEKVLQLGKNHKIYNRRFYRFDEVFEFGPGIVVTKDMDGYHLNLHLCPNRYELLSALSPVEAFPIVPGLVSVRLGMGMATMSNDIVEVQRRLGQMFRPRRSFPIVHTEVVVILWQRRPDLKPTEV